MRPHVMTPAHKTDLPAELVCSNSLKSDQLPTAHGLLKAELSLLRSPLLTVAQNTRVPAGTALAVDREMFSQQVQKLLHDESNITLINEEISSPPPEHTYCIIAAGPLASDSLSQWLMKAFSKESLYFYDAIAPIIAAESIDMEKAFYASRWDKGGADYCNCPFTKEEYTRFYQELTTAEVVKTRDFENEKYFEACLPVEVVAGRGFDALAYGSLRPVGLFNPGTGKRSYAVCQLRKENIDAISLNMVGFQTRMTIGEQKRVFRMIPGLEQADFLRYGSIHRNTYLNSPSLLTRKLSFKSNDKLFLAGQLCGSEGYSESIATGHLAALSVYASINKLDSDYIPDTTACGSLLNHVIMSDEKTFSPSNINYGLFVPLTQFGGKKIRKREKQERLSERAICDMKSWIEKNI